MIEPSKGHKITWFGGDHPVEGTTNVRPPAPQFGRVARAAVVVMVAAVLLLAGWVIGYTVWSGELQRLDVLATVGLIVFLGCIVAAAVVCAAAVWRDRERTRR